MGAAPQLLDPQIRKFGASRKRFRMVAPQSRELAFQELFLDRDGSLIIALGNEKIPQCRDRTKPQLVVCSQNSRQVPNHAFEQTLRQRLLARLRVRNAYLRHQAKRLRMIGAEAVLVIAERRVHPGKLGRID